jgi:hypothetical protein
MWDPSVAIVDTLSVTPPGRGTLRSRELLPKPGQGKVTVSVGTGLVIGLGRRARGCVGHPDGTGAVINHPGNVDT